jgi:hypothetical protein
MVWNLNLMFCQVEDADKIIDYNVMTLFAVGA